MRSLHACTTCFFFIVLLDLLNALNLCKHVLHNHFVQFNTSLLSLGHVAQRANKSHNYKWHWLDSFLARALTRARTFNGSKGMSFSGMGRVTGYGRSRVQVLLYCWPLRFVFVHAKALGFLKESARSVFAEKTPAVMRYLPVRFRRTTSARANVIFSFFFFCLFVEYQANANAPDTKTCSLGPMSDLGRQSIVAHRLGK